MVVYISVDQQEDGQWLARVTDRPEIFAYGSSFKEAGDRASLLLNHARVNQAQTEKALLETEEGRPRIVLSDDFIGETHDI